MQPLVLEYVFEGHQRGYNFTSPTRGYRAADLKAIWRNAMPRGQGWAAYTGARSLKSFALDDGRLALSEVTVTDRRDESGRGGIRRAVIQVMYPGAYVEYLKDRLRRFPEAVRAAVDRWPSLSQRGQLFDRARPRLRGDSQIVCAYPYRDPESWLMTEAILLKLALTPGLLLRSGFLPFTTLALECRDEGVLVALPADRASRLNGVPVIAL
ncbi:MAG: hypothetical protein DWB42_14295 [Chloroflexi bacterium]|nr:hypothetical protein [Chloroflexota bacterium]MDL1884277.1 hypothetical protein [Anaerolineae bacterium CFX8]